MSTRHGYLALGTAKRLRECEALPAELLVHASMGRAWWYWLPRLYSAGGVEWYVAIYWLAGWVRIGTVIKPAQERGE
jgi:hypothetical protein